MEEKSENLKRKIKIETWGGNVKRRGKKIKNFE